MPVSLRRTMRSCLGLARMTYRMYRAKERSPLVRHRPYYHIRSTWQRRPSLRRFRRQISVACACLFEFFLCLINLLAEYMWTLLYKWIKRTHPNNSTWWRLDWHHDRSNPSHLPVSLRSVSPLWRTAQTILLATITTAAGLTMPTRSPTIRRASCLEQDSSRRAFVPE